MSTISAGIVSMGLYRPGQTIAKAKAEGYARFLKTTLLPPEYIDILELEQRLPGRIETNHDGWKSQPWFQTWLDRLPEKKKADPFQGTTERRRVPFDPLSVRASLQPHPMLPSDAETIAGAMALVNGNIPKDRVDLLITASQVPDLLLPSNASLTQHKLGLPNAGAYHVDTCCSSFITMLEVATALVQSGIKRTVLIIASYIDSFVVDKTTYYSVNTGDAATAAIVTAVENGYGYLASHSTSFGDRHDGIIFQRRPPEILRPTPHGPDFAQIFTTFYNPEADHKIAVNTVKDMTQVVNAALHKRDLTIGDIDFLATHQPVQWAANAWREGLNVPEEKFYETFHAYGNIANCSVPMNLGEAVERGLIGSGDLALLASSGAGENYIALLEKITPQLVDSLAVKR